MLQPNTMTEGQPPMYTRIEDFASDWEKELELTAAVMEALTDASLGQPVAEGRRTLGQIAWHLVQSPAYMAALGLVFEGPAGDEPPASAAFIASEYRRVAEALLQAVRAQWTDAELPKSQQIAGEEWRNGASLRFTLLHQVHHRGQMTVLMRQAGLRVPDLYGPTYDTWVEKGMEPLA